MVLRYEPGDIITYEGRVWDVDARAWDTFDRGTRGDQPRPQCTVVSETFGVPGVNDHVRVKLAGRWSGEPYEYLIFDIDKIERA